MLRLNVSIVLIHDNETAWHLYYLFYQFKWVNNTFRLHAIVDWPTNLMLLWIIYLSMKKLTADFAIEFLHTTTTNWTNTWDAIDRQSIEQFQTNCCSNSDSINIICLKCYWNCVIVKLFKSKLEFIIINDCALNDIRNYTNVRTGYYLNYYTYASIHWPTFDCLETGWRVGNLFVEKSNSYKKWITITNPRRRHSSKLFSYFCCEMWILKSIELLCVTFMVAAGKFLFSKRNLSN